MKTYQMKTYHWIAVASVVLACCLSSSTALGQIITLVNDTFDDGNFNNGAGLDTEWYAQRVWQNNDSNPAPDGYEIRDDNVVGGIGTGNALFINRVNRFENGASADLLGAGGGAGGEGTEFNGGGPSFGTGQAWQLANTGDFIKLEFDYRLLGDIPDNNNGFRFGFMSREESADFPGGSANFPRGTFDDKTFYASSGTGGTSDELVLVQEWGANEHPFSGNDRDVSALALKTNFDDDDSVGHASFTLTKLDFGEIRAEVNLNGDLNSWDWGSTPGGTADGTFNPDGTLVPGSIPASVPAQDSFDSFAIMGFSSSANSTSIMDILVDNVVVTALATQIPGLPGDFDVDGDVDGADFLAWQRDLGDASNLALWEANFGETGAAGAVLAAVPEPASLLLVGIAAVATWTACRRHRLTGV